MEDPLLKILKMKKEAFWIENCHLQPHEIQRQWTAESSRYLSVFSGAAPTQPVDIGSSAQKPSNHQDLPSSYQSSPVPAKMLNSTSNGEKPDSVYQLGLRRGHR